MKLEELTKLPEDDQASRLLHGLESPVYQVADGEVARRIQEAGEDPGVMIKFEEMKAGMNWRS